MADQLQLRRGTTAQIAAFTGAQGEVIVDTDKDTLVVQDGATVGGFPLATEKGLVDGTFYFNDDTSGGSIANSYILSPKANTNTPTVYKDGQQFGFVTANANTGPATATFAGLGVRSLKWPGGIDPTTGEISGRVYLIFDATNNWFEIQDIERSLDYLNTTRIDVPSAGVVDLTALAPNTRNIRLTGTTTVNSFTVTIGKRYLVTLGGDITLTNGSPIVTNRGANIVGVAGDTVEIRATAANVVEVCSYSRIQQLVRGTSVNASGTSVDFTGIPSWARLITVMISGISASASSTPQLQIGAGSIETSGYLGCLGANAGSNTTATLQLTSGVLTDNASTAASVVHGIVTFANIGANTWSFFGAFGLSNSPRAMQVGGSKSLAGVLDRVRLTTVNGTDTFDAGTVNIIYEG